MLAPLDYPNVQRPDVLLLVFDTLRPDFLSPYQSEVAVETPAFDSVADAGTVFKNTFSAGPNTEISHGAMFTGQYPSESGLVGWNVTIPPDHELLAESFQRAGYRTVGISGPGKIRSELGFDRGFDEYVEPYHEHIKPRPTAAYLKRAATDPVIGRDFVRTLRRGRDALTAVKFEYLQRWLTDADAPTFAFVNFLTCHTPYDPPRPYKTEAVDGYECSRWFVVEYLKELLGLDAERITIPNVRPERVLRAAGGEGGPYFADPTWLNDDELAVLRAWYRASVRYLDARLGRFLDWLRDTGQFEDTILVLTADHGEHLGEDGLLYHGRTLRDEVLHVPLIISGPGVPSGVRRSDPVSLVDLFPTLSSLAGIDAPDSPSGYRLFGDEQQEAVFAEIGGGDWSTSKFAEYYTDEQKYRFSLGQKCIRTARHKLILFSDGTTAAYDLSTGTECDVKEPPYPELKERLRETIGDRFEEADGIVPDNDRIAQNLRDLGYLE